MNLANLAANEWQGDASAIYVAPSGRRPGAWYYTAPTGVGCGTLVCALLTIAVALAGFVYTTMSLDLFSPHPSAEATTNTAFTASICLGSAMVLLGTVGGLCCFTGNTTSNRGRVHPKVCGVVLQRPQQWPWVKALLGIGLVLIAVSTLTAVVYLQMFSDCEADDDDLDGWAGAKFCGYASSSTPPCTPALASVILPCELILPAYWSGFYATCVLPLPRVVCNTTRPMRLRVIEGCHHQSNF